VDNISRTTTRSTSLASCPTAAGGTVLSNSGARSASSRVRAEDPPRVIAGKLRSLCVVENVYRVRADGVRQKGCSIGRFRRARSSGTSEKDRPPRAHLKRRRLVRPDSRAPLLPQIGIRVHIHDARVCTEAHPAIPCRRRRPNMRRQRPPWPRSGDFGAALPSGRPD